MMFHVAHDLIVLMPFSGDENDVSRHCHCHGRAYRLPSVGYSDYVFRLCGLYSRLHIVEYGFGLFVSRVVRREDYLVALACRLLCHERAFSLVAVSSASAYGDDSSLSVEHFVYGVEHVLESVGRVCIVHDSRHSVSRAYGFEASCHTLQR